MALKWHREAVWWRAGDPGNLRLRHYLPHHRPVHHHPVRDPQDEDLCSGAAASFVGVLSALPIRAQWFPCAWSLMCAMEAYSEI